MKSSELALIESQSLREQYMSRVEVLDKVKALVMLTDDTHATTEIVANYYEVDTETIKKLVQRHRVEMARNGYKVLKGDDLRELKRDNVSLLDSKSLAVFTRRTMLNIGQLLTGSAVAEAVRTRLLDSEEARRQTEPVGVAVVDDLALMETMLHAIRADRARLAVVESNQQELTARMDGIEGKHDWFAALAYAKISGISTERVYLQRLGTAASRITRRMGFEPAKTQHALFGFVNTYPIAALDGAAEALGSAA